MKPTLIAGLGNEGLQDEAAGIFLLHQLEKILPHTLFRFTNLENSLLNILSSYQGEKNIFLLTSGYLNKPAGEYLIFPTNEPEKSFDIIGLPGIVIDTLFAQMPQIKKANIWTLAIQVKWNEWGDELSPEISLALKQIRHIIWHILETLNFIEKIPS